jgi:hypothetical protein
MDESKNFQIPFKIVIACFIAFIVLACAQVTPIATRAPSPSSPSPSLPITHRTFRVGVAGLVPRHFPNATQADWLDLYQNLNQTGELLGVYQLWRDSPEKAGEIPAAIQTVCALAKQYGFTPVIALGFHQMTAQGYTPVLSTRDNPQNDWRNPDARAKYVQVAARVAKDCPAPYLALGVEVTGYYEDHPDDFDNFVSAYREVYDAVKQASPHTRVFTIFQLEAMKGKGFLSGRTRQPMWSLITKFEPKLDLVGFTTYPMLDYKSPGETPADYYAEIRQHTTLPLAFTEIGWISQEKFTGQLAALNEQGWTGSQQEQTDFATRFLELTRDLPVAIVLWTLPHDLAASSASDALFASTGLKQNDGTPKRVWELWRALAALPYAPQK